MYATEIVFLVGGLSLSLKTPASSASDLWCMTLLAAPWEERLWPPLPCRLVRAMHTGTLYDAQLQGFAFLVTPVVCSQSLIFSSPFFVSNSSFFFMPPFPSILCMCVFSLGWEKMGCHQRTKCENHRIEMDTVFIKLHFQGPC